MFKTSVSQHNMLISITLLMVFCILAFSASVIGIDDNPPGIALAYLSTIALVLTFVHSMRTSKQFRYLIYTSGFSFVFFAVFHNVFEGIASKVGETSILYGLLNGVGGAFFLIATLVCPSGLLVGAIGAVIMSRRERRSKQGSLTT